MAQQWTFRNHTPSMFALLTQTPPTNAAPVGGALPRLEDLPSLHWINHKDAETMLYAVCEATGFGLRKAGPEDKDQNGFYRRHVYSCWKQKAKPPSQKRLEAAARIPIEKRRKREPKSGTCEWQCVLKYKAEFEVWTFDYVKGRNKHDHPLVANPAAFPSSRRRARRELFVEAEIETLSIHPKATAAMITQEIQMRHPEVGMKRSDVNNIIKRFREEDGCSPWPEEMEGTSQQPQNLNISAAQRPGFWFNLCNKLSPEARMVIFTEFARYNGAANAASVNASTAGPADAPGSPDAAAFMALQQASR